MKKLFAILLFCAFAVFSIQVKNRSLLAQEASKIEALPNGQPMPNFSLKDTTGQEYTLSQLTKEKKLILVNFWGTWCAPCRLEMPDFEKLYQAKSKDGLLILAIDEGDQRSELDTYLKNKPVSFPVLLDPDNTLVKKLGIQVFPTSVLVGSDGKIFEVNEGMNPSWLEYMVDDYLQNSERPK